MTSLLADARYAGLIDWNAIEDRGRTPDTPSEFVNISDLMEAALRSYRLPRWDGQVAYVELWVEKQALAGVLAPIAWEHHVTLMVNKGYSSASAMKDASDRFKRYTKDCGPSGVQDKLPILFYLGDHDPSGEDMVRDIGARLVEFGVKTIRVEKLALTMEQIKKYNPPPNPAKRSDSRSKAYIEKHGEHSWEVDALNPNILTKLIEGGVQEGAASPADERRHQARKSRSRASP